MPAIPLDFYTFYDFLDEEEPRTCEPATKKEKDKDKGKEKTHTLGLGLGCCF